jgi:uncharacterized membrane protein YdjX (TVP38/TMEM64 family)
MRVRNALFRLPAKSDPKAFPWVTFTDPELAQVGLTEGQARQQHGDGIRVLCADFSKNDRAQAEDATEGFLKAVLSKRGRVLGATIVGAHAGELILPWVLAISERLRIGAIADLIAPYPTLSEISKQAAGKLLHTHAVFTANAQIGALFRNARMSLKRLAPLLVLLVLIAVAFFLRLDRYFTLDALRENRAALTAFVQSHSLAAALGFVLTYIGVVALSVPGATIMTLAGGFLFGVPLGAALTIIGATAGASLLFLIARTAFGDVLRNRAGPFLARMADGFRNDAFNYLLFLRLVPVFPFWAVNLAPALLGMRLLPFVAATALGIVPATLVYSAFGASLGHIFDAGAEVSLNDVFSPTLIAALIGVGILSLLPVVLRRWREGRRDSKS